MFTQILSLVKKIKYRILRLLVGLKHRVFYATELLPCWCKKSHNANFFAAFKPVLAKVLQQFERNQLLPQMFKNWTFMIKEKTTNSLPLAKDIKWHCNCKKTCQDACVKHPAGKLFYLDWLSQWSQNLYAGPCLNQDLRGIWEKSRLQWLLPFIWGAAQNDGNNFFVKEVLVSWVEQNKFLTGPNWSCAMEVAIRAINILWLASGDGFAESIKQTLCRQLCLHGKFIVDTLEEFDRPNNHLLADLVGLLYLTAFFQNQAEFERWQKYFDAAILAQTNPDGSHYEGSSQYHLLVLEMLWHRIFLAYALGQVVDLEILALAKRMQQFASACSEPALSLGDDDSSKLVFGLELQPALQSWPALFKDFGLWRDRQQGWSLALNVIRPLNHRPSGHLHFDCLSLQLSFAGQPILIDAGSGWYSRQPRLRNFLRGPGAHSSFFPQEWLKNATQQPLFCMQGPCMHGQLIEPCLGQVLGLCQSQDFVRQRELEWLLEQNKIVGVKIVDQIKNLTAEKPFFWQLNFAPEIKIVPHDAKSCFIKTVQKSLFLSSNFELTAKKNLYAKRYGQFDLTNSLRAILRPQELALIKVTIRFLD